MSTFWTSLRHAAPTDRHDWVDAVRDAGLPTTSDEVWRYAPLGELDTTTFVGGDETVTPMANALVVVNGEIVSNSPVAGVTVTSERRGTLPDSDGDGFESLAFLLAPQAYVISIPATLTEPLIIDQQFTSAFAGVDITVKVAAGASATVVERIRGGADSFISATTRIELAERAQVVWSTYQSLADSAWFIARSRGILARDAHLTQNYAGVGARYDRARQDCELRETGAENRLMTTYVGHGNQIHDLRTHQLHLAPRTTATLVSKGAVGDSSRSIYTGLIEMEKGARRADARQSNHNLLLSNVAHADTVPNLDIRENDVTCAHASSVGPLDEMTRWYLESRGVPRAVAERLMVLGFFNEMLAAWPAQLADTVAQDIATIIDDMVVFA